MLVLEFNIGDEKYGLKAIEIIEIIPLVELKKIPLSEPLILGLLNYRGSPTLIIDLSQIFEKKYSNKSLSTRIIIINHKTKNNQSHLIGIVAEKITDIINLDESKLTHSQVQKNSHSPLNLIYKKNNHFIQLVKTENIIPETINNKLAGILA